MKLSVITTLALFGSVLAAPAPASESDLTPAQIEKRAILNSVANIVNTLDTSVTASVLNINFLIANIKNNPAASLAVASPVGANFDNIKAAFKVAATDIKQSTTGLLGGLIAITTSLSQSQVDQLAQTIYQAAAILHNVRLSVYYTARDMSPASLSTIAGSISAAQASILPFANPLVKFADSVSKSRASLGLTLTGLNGAITGLGNIISILTADIAGPGTGSGIIAPLVNGLLGGLGLGL